MTAAVVRVPFLASDPGRGPQGPLIELNSTIQIKGEPS